ncbi:hypothetical protein MRS44_014638 [Fusarium solani]|jgi:hypothetical protein|uniref:uncharacterized protein n=1 Tax=Fusarium solani TaxID=169388 RepID=UPI0032C48807|nr:hypothetical protein MRS44_014638 [Fusarium solani]
MSTVKVQEIHMGQSLTSVIFRERKAPDTSDQIGNSRGMNEMPETLSPGDSTESQRETSSDQAATSNGDQETFRQGEMGQEEADRTGARRARPGCASGARGRFGLPATEASDWSQRWETSCTAPAPAYRQGREAQHSTPQQHNAPFEP